ncbi:putative aluminum-activated malate transporter [Helianthus annuus]|uniref:Aluminum-activated malate transporter n=1 Tax=Helianthus annuus TaxID=4232 RepID=A0A9K3NF69_HELAN|nr:putative aluminum-activated malate transporter [Helianthus annuus]KAJ0549331.1 putative aluminum-activated malate transporter [Helianthus annuus]KAJ0562284.1 putative aluminum-activated malate transporter [Helianthus annuus]KAJ0727663.1 putative aluminum-activated malate transporter [Helianthus annuus]KAJ0730458.1 putative aluminum-activated malate transporter [Helianthus annuus]
MNGKEGGFVVEISSSTKDELPKTSNKAAVFMYAILDFAKEDRNRVTFSLKVGLAVLLVSLLILVQAPYKVFGTTIIWSILTVAIMFEYTVGATFHKGFNRALGSLFAGVLAVAVAELALMGGPVAEPIIIGISIFVIGTLTSFMKLWPTLVPYEYGFRVILFTYCLIIVSGYRMGNPVRTSIERFYSIVIGAIVTVAVNTLIFPIWAGEQLHMELVKNFNSVADSLEAKWEPPHGRFRQAFYPWSEYVKVGTVLRYCAYEIMGLHGVLHSQIQAPYNLRVIFETEILEATNKAAELIRCLGKDIYDMKQTRKCSLLKNAHSSTEKLQRVIDARLFNKDYNTEEPEINYQSQRQSMSLVTFTSLLIEFVARLDHLVEAVNELSKMAKFKPQSL